MKKLFAIWLVILLAVTACVFTACDGETAAPDLSSGIERAGDKPSDVVDPGQGKTDDPTDPGEGESGNSGEGESGNSGGGNSGGGESGKEEDPSGDEGDPEAHGHDYYWVNEIPATCQAAGEKGHYACSGCELTFDEEYEPLEDLVIPQRAHDLSDPISGYAATCDEIGMVDHKTCSTCDKYFDLDGNVIESIEIPAGHLYGAWIPERAATCTEDGEVGHYECGRCHLYFNADHEILDDTVIPASHDKEYVEYKNATCEEDGVEAHYECKVCGAWLNDYDDVLDPEDLVIHAQHHFDWRDGWSADCYSTGRLEHYYCNVCGKYFDTGYNYLGDDESVVYLPYDHAELSDWIAEKAVTCTEDGEVGHYYCSYCEYNLDAQLNQIDDIVIKATGHEFEGATCQKCGKTLVVSAGLSSEVNGEGTCRITGIGTFEGTELVIPEKIGDDTVTEIAANAFANRTELTIVYVPESVVKIGESAFAGCSSLDTLIIPFVGECATIEDNTYIYKKFLGYMFSKEEFEGSYYVSESYRYGYGNSYSRSVVRYIPTSLRSVLVMGGDTPYSFYNCRELRSVSLGAKVETVGRCAFSGCQNLITVTLGEGVKRIEDEAFNGCDSLRTLVVPSGLTYIGDVTFPYSVQVEYEDGSRYVGNEENPYLVMTKGASTVHQDTKFIAQNAFNPHTYREAEWIETAVLPEGLIGISASAFDYSKVTSVTFPSTLKYIGYQAFAHTSNLRSIEIPVGTVIGERAFQGATGLESATIGGTLGEDMIFNGCTSLESVTITAEGPETVIGYRAFYQCAFTSIVLPARVTEIGGCAFQNCESLISVECLGDIDAIRESAFYMCTALESINATPQVIGGSAFNNCRSLKSFDFSNVVGVDEYAFLTCTSLESINMPATLSYINNYAFSGCSSVTSITGVDNASFKYANNCIVYDRRIIVACKNSSIPQDGSVTEIGTGAFANLGSAITHLTIPASVTFVGKQAFYGCDLETITVAAGNTAFEIIDNCLITKSNKTLILGSANTVIPTDPSIVTSIGEYAFGRNAKLTSITIPDNITWIGDGAFEYTGLRSVSLPDSVQYLGDRAFQYCLDLEEVTSLGSITYLREKTFTNCPSLTEVHIGASVTSISQDAFRTDKDENATPIGSIYFDFDMATYLTKNYFGNVDFAGVSYYLDGALIEGAITIPDGVTGIATRAFVRKAITSVEIPVTVTYLGEFCFASCKELTSITYEGTKTQWESINKEYGWIQGSATCTVHCADEEEIVYNQ